mgnify:CR=1 FL=1
MRMMTTAEITALHAARTAKGDGYAPSLAECLDAAREGRLYDIDTQSSGCDGLEIGDDADEVLASWADACGCESVRGWSAEQIAMATRTLTVAIDTACALGGEPLIWGIAEGDNSDAAIADAAQWIAGGDTPTKRHRRDAEALDLTTIQWPATEPRPDGQSRRAIALALKALA